MRTKVQKGGPLPPRPEIGPRSLVLPPALLLAALGIALVIAFSLYGPALQAPFVFDDVGLPYYSSARPPSDWVSGVRPVLMFSYWLNRMLSGDKLSGYHSVNVLIHVCNALLVFFVLLRLLERASWDKSNLARAAAVGALVFLIHPLQTESVSYIAGRSESLATLFVPLAYTAFLYRRHDSISWLESCLVLALLVLAIRSKENAVSFAGVIVLTDYFWTTPFSVRGLRRNWRLYFLMLPGVVLGTLSVLRMLASAPSAGFSLRTFTWYQYAFTEARAIFMYIRLALFPVGLSLDRDFAISHTILEHAAIIWMALLAALVVAAWRLRRRYPVASFGLLLFLILLAPTSSVVPIADPLVERRMYLPLLGLILVSYEVLRRIRLRRETIWTAGAVALFVLGALCYFRNQEWSHPEELMASAALQSVHNVRPYLNLTQVLVQENRCSEAIPYLQRADRLFSKSYETEIAWGTTLECLGRREAAMDRLQQAAALNPNSRVYEWIGLLYGEMNQLTAAGEALQKAVEMNPNSVSAHEALALWYEKTENLTAAREEHAKSLALDPYDQHARFSLARLQQFLVHAAGR